MESTISTISLDVYSNKSRANKLISNFENEFDGKKPEAIIRVPGRVNLIGEHTDYNDGFVLPMALPLVTLVVGRKREIKFCEQTILNENKKFCVVTTSKECDLPHKIEEDFRNLKPGKPK